MAGVASTGQHSIEKFSRFIKLLAEFFSIRRFSVLLPEFFILYPENRGDYFGSARVRFGCRVYSEIDSNENP